MNIVAIDECGRGAGYGPLAIGLVLVKYKKSFNIEEKDIAEENIMQWARDILQLQIQSLDSKTLSEFKRKELFDAFPLPYVVIFKGAEELNKRGKGALNSIFMEMIEEGIQRLEENVDFLLCDASLLTPPGYSYINITKGDFKYPSIGISSVMCKTLRDILIDNMAEDEDPLYDLVNNKGYLTPKHIEGLKRLGMTKNHRVSFCKNYTTTFSTPKDLINPSES